MCTFQLKDKNILVTGSAGFLGQHIMRALTVEGANPIGADLHDADYDLDLSDEHSISQLFHRVTAKYGYLDGLVNNAAIGCKGTDKHVTRDEFEKTLSVNVSGTNSCIYWFSKSLKNASIVNVASIYGCLSPDFRIYMGDEKEFNAVAYGASKAGVIQLTKYQAVLLASRGVRVNAVSPGGIQQNHDAQFDFLYSDRVPMQRMAQPEEIVNAILFLLSPLSSYITGQNLVVDGGLSAW